MTRPLEHPLTPDTSAAAPATAAEAFGDLPDTLPPDFDVGEAIAPNLLPLRRGDGWTADRQRAFCDAPISS